MPAGSIVPPTSASSMARPEVSRMSVATVASLMPASSSSSMDAIGLARAFLDQRLAIAGEIVQLANRCRRHEASRATIHAPATGRATHNHAHRSSVLGCRTWAAFASRQIADALNRKSLGNLNTSWNQREHNPDGQGCSTSKCPVSA
jgi:hypothetical protein